MGKRVEQTLLKGRHKMVNKCAKVLNMGKENENHSEIPLYTRMAKFKKILKADSSKY